MLARVTLPMKADWPGKHLRPLPLFLWKNKCAKLGYFERVLSRSADAALFAERGSGAPKAVPHAKGVFFLRRPG